MASPRLVKSLRNLKRRRRPEVLVPQSKKKRKLHLALLEDRRLMAQGPSLVSVIPNNGVFLKNNDLLNVAPREITFRFAQGNSIDPATLASNTFDLEWPPRSGRRQSFTEVDRAEWFNIESARQKLLSAQAELLDGLLAIVDGTEASCSGSESFRTRTAC